jgi:riboflavin kinase/FMN adenylyltransferase
MLPPMLVGGGSGDPVTTKLADELRRFRTTDGTAITIGTFDGVHRGHQFVVEQLVGQAMDRQLRSVVITFHPSPRTVLRPDSAGGQLGDIDERVTLLKSLGVDFVVPLTFDLGVAQLRAREFTGLLTDELSLQHLVVGPDFALGNRREGTPDVLREIGGESGFTVELLEPLTDGSPDRVSSTAIRRALGDGDVIAAERMLGRPYDVTGRVVRGYHRGREIGFPTANVAVLPPKVVPGDGVYITRAYVNGEAKASATNIGNNPTFENPNRSVESFILDFDADIYEVDLRLEFLERIRGEERFDSVEALIAQIGRDVDQTRAYFGHRAG